MKYKNVNLTKKNLTNIVKRCKNIKNTTKIVDICVNMRLAFLQNESVKSFMPGSFFGLPRDWFDREQVN